VAHAYFQSARVTLKGSLNGAEFTISRTKTSTKGSLTFLYGNQDLTAQSVTETQLIINETLGLSPAILARTMFHGQHALNELLESTDTGLKEELSLVVNISLWQDATALTRKRAREALKRISELDGMLSVRSEDVEKLTVRLFDMKQTYHSLETVLAEHQKEFQSKFSGSQSETSISQLQDELFEAETVLSGMVSKRQSAMIARNEEVKRLQEQIDELQCHLTIAEQQWEACRNRFSNASTCLALVQARIDTLQKQWNIDLSLGVQESFDLPDMCPTCHQPLSRPHSHNNSLHANVLHDITSSVSEIADAKQNRDIESQALDSLSKSLVDIRASFLASQQELVKRQSFWSMQLEEIEAILDRARSVQERISTDMTVAATRHIETQSTRQAAVANIQVEEHRLKQLRDSVELLQHDLYAAERKQSAISLEQSEQTARVDLMTELSQIFGQRGIQSFVLQDAIYSLESLTQSYLDVLSDGSQRLEIDIDASERITRRAYVMGTNGSYHERALASLSGGQWKRCSLALSFGFAALVSRRASFVPSLCILDEPLTHLDQSGRFDAGRLFRSLLVRSSERRQQSVNDYLSSAPLRVSTVIIILQDLAAEELQQSFDSIDEVSRENGYSTVSVDVSSF
jgi:DNA repair exonuclease SbcCD ATPase subunit